jgi:hypothetical protein
MRSFVYGLLGGLVAVAIVAGVLLVAGRIGGAGFGPFAVATPTAAVIRGNPPPGYGLPPDKDPRVEDTQRQLCELRGGSWVMSQCIGGR